MYKIMRLFLFIFLFLASFANAWSATDEQREELHAQPWAFGRSEDRSDPIWHKGIDGDKINKNRKISSRLKKGQDNAKKTLKNSFKSSLGVRWKDESGNWKVTPSQQNIRPDEKHPRENSHILGAYADVKAGENLNFSIGPELIIRDDSKGNENANADQPDSTWGLGMKFKYDF